MAGAVARLVAPLRQNANQCVLQSRGRLLQNRNQNFSKFPVSRDNLCHKLLNNWKNDTSSCGFHLLKLQPVELSLPACKYFGNTATNTLTRSYHSGILQTYFKNVVRPWPHFTVRGYAKCSKKKGGKKKGKKKKKSNKPKEQKEASGEPKRVPCIKLAQMKKQKCSADDDSGKAEVKKKPKKVCKKKKPGTAPKKKKSGTAPKKPKKPVACSKVAKKKDDDKESAEKKAKDDKGAGKGGKDDKKCAKGGKGGKDDEKSAKGGKGDEKSAKDEKKSVEAEGTAKEKPKCPPPPAAAPKAKTYSNETKEVTAGKVPAQKPKPVKDEGDAACKRANSGKKASNSNVPVKKQKKFWKFWSRA